ncbi:MAG: hypothetical protein AAGI92_06590 [Pseudomonadota bacterium]
MTDSKPWYLSRTIWASLVSIAASLAAFFGIETDETTRAAITDTLMQMLAAVAGIAAIFGRISARSTIN